MEERRQALESDTPVHSLLAPALSGTNFLASVSTHGDNTGITPSSQACDEGGQSGYNVPAL